jgi:hypothetical protein
MNILDPNIWLTARPTAIINGTRKDHIADLPQQTDIIRITLTFIALHATYRAASFAASNGEINTRRTETTLKVRVLRDDTTNRLRLKLRSATGPPKAP